MASHTQIPAPSIPRDPVPGKDPPHTSPNHEQPGGEDFDRDGNTDDELAVAQEQDSRAMPPPPAPTNARRTSYRAVPGEGGQAPQSPGIMVTQPTSEFASLKGKPAPMGDGDASQREREGNTQHSLEFNEGLAGTAGTVRHIDGDQSGRGSTQIQRPDFAPFFTLVHDIGNTKTGESADGGSASKTFHPNRVHYIFADDEENGVLTEALVRSLEASDRFCLMQDAGSGRGQGPDVEREMQREERVVIVDMNETGDGIKGAYSANPKWAVLSAEVGNAPTWDGNSSEDGTGSRMGGMMLRIEGIGVESGASKSNASSTNINAGGDGKQSATASGAGVSEEEMQNLMEGFDRKMTLLRRIVASGEEFGRGKSREIGDDGNVEA